MQHCLILKLRKKRILSFSIKSIPLPELVQRHSILLLFQTNLVNWQCKAPAQIYDVSELKKGSSYKKCISRIFSWVEKHFFPFFSY